MLTPGELRRSSSSQIDGLGSGRILRAHSAADPNHQRQPRLGEIHQSLENEQEAQVNRLLSMIRIQQDQIAQTKSQQQHPREPSPSSIEQTHFPTPTSTISTPEGTVATEQSSPRSASIFTLPHAAGHFNRPRALSRISSTRLSSAGTHGRTGSPAMPPAGSIDPSTEDFRLGGMRDECSFYRAETQTLTRENQMLRQRMQELERQIAAFNATYCQVETDVGAPPTRSTAPSSALASPSSLNSSGTAPSSLAQADSITKAD